MVNGKICLLSFRSAIGNLKGLLAKGTERHFAEFMTEEQQVFLKHIQKQGLKRTSQRDLILDVFLRTEAHLSSEDLYQLVKKEDPAIGQTTVYRTLKLLTDAGGSSPSRSGLK